MYNFPNINYYLLYRVITSREMKLIILHRPD